MDTQWPQGYAPGRSPWIKVLDKMIATDLLKTLISVWTVIVVIIVSRKFIKILDRAVEGQISNETLLTILGLKTVSAGIALIPAATFTALLMVIGRLYKDQEMSAIFAAGGGAGTLYRAVFLLAFPLSVVTLGLSLYVSPWAESRILRLTHLDEQSSDIRGIAAGKFSEYSGGNLVFYVESIDSKKVMHSVFVHDRKQERLSIITSETSHLQDLPGGRYMVFQNGERVVGRPGEYNYSIESFREYAVKVQEKALETWLTPNAMPADVLLQSKIPKQIAEIQDRFALPLGILLLSFLAVPLAKVSPRGGVYGSILLGFLAYFSYGNLSGVFKSWVIKGSVPSWPGIFWISFLMFIIGAGLLARWYGFQWLADTFKKRWSK